MKADLNTRNRKRMYDVRYIGKNAIAAATAVPERMLQDGCSNAWIDRWIPWMDVRAIMIAQMDGNDQIESR